MEASSLNELRKVDIFKNLKEETLEKLINVSTIKLIKKGKMLFWDKEKINDIYIILEGKVTVFKISEVANKRIMFILSEGEIINEVIVEEDLNEASSCETFEDSKILKINKKDFINIMMMDFDFNKKVISSLTRKVRKLYRQLKNTSMLKIERRVAAKLYRLAKDYGTEEEYGILIKLNISITYLADMLGVTRETVSRALKKLQELELINVIKRKIYIKDMDKLVYFFKH